MSIVAQIDTNHRDMIHDAQVDYYGTRLATCSSDRIVRLFDVRPTGQSYPITDLSGHEGPVWQVSWSHPSFGSLLASCSYDHRVIVWQEVDKMKWSKLYEYNQHEASVNSVSWAPYQLGCMLAAASTDKSLSVLKYQEDNSWSTTRIPSAHEQGANAVSWAPYMPDYRQQQQGSTGLGSAQPCRLVSGGNDQLVKIWKCSSSGEWSSEQSLEGHTDWVRDVAWAPACTNGTSLIASCGQDMRVIIWKCKNMDTDNWQWEQTRLPKFNDVVWHVSWSCFNCVLAVSCADNKVSLWKETLEGEWRCISEQEQADGTELNRADG